MPAKVRQLLSEPPTGASVGYATTMARPRFKPCIATMSLGSPSHDLTHKIQVASVHGFRGIELYWDDLVHDCRKEFPGVPGPPAETEDAAPSPKQLQRTARRIRHVCDRAGIEVVSLQPFRDFDGLECPRRREERIREFEEAWIPCALVLGASMVAVPASIDPRGKSRDPEHIARDVCALAEWAARYFIKIAYEALCFSATVDTWEGCHDVVERVRRMRPDLANVGIILDTFNIAGKVIPYGCEGGIRESAGLLKGGCPRPEKVALPKATLAGLASGIPHDEVLLVQVADLDFETEPTCGHDRVSSDCIKNYSRNHRLFPLESRNQGIQRDLLRAITRRVDDDPLRKVRAGGGHESGIGYEGWISIEVFNRSTRGEGVDVVGAHAKRAWRSWVRMCEEMGWAESERENWGVGCHIDVA
jgi:4-hydroxyphenylpyruvate dioxygenase